MNKDKSGFEMRENLIKDIDEKLLFSYDEMKDYANNVNKSEFYHGVLIGITLFIAAFMIMLAISGKHIHIN